MKKDRSKNRGNLGSKGQNFNAGEGRNAGQQPKTAGNKPNQSMNTIQDREDWRGDT